MDRLRKAAIVNCLIHEMHKQGSWCGETNIQKSVYVLQEVMCVDLGYEFILYKHGPFSFGLRDELTAMRGDELLELTSQLGYGPRYFPTQTGDELATRFPKTLKGCSDQVSFVAEYLGDRGIADLERLATAFWIMNSSDLKLDVDKIAKTLTKLKPHIKENEAADAAKEAQNILQTARKKGIISN